MSVMVHYREALSEVPWGHPRSDKDTPCGIPSEAFTFTWVPNIPVKTPAWTYTKDFVTCPFCRELLGLEAPEEAP